jgi:phenylacetate-CoA ligase
MMNRLIYIGNNLGGKTKYTPQLSTLSGLLKKEGYTFKIASSKLNKFLRIFDMLFTVLWFSNKSKIVLIDTFGAFNFFFAVAVSQLCRIVGISYIPILRGGNLPDRFINNPCSTRLLFKYSFINVTPSNYLKTELEKVGYTADIIPNIIDIQNYSFKKRTNYSPKLLYVRAFHQIYNPTMAIRVLHKLQKTHPEATLCMIGPPKDASFEATKVLAKALGVEDSVTYTGVLSKKEWHQEAVNYDIFINTTNVDNTPVSVMEAMAMGLPVVTTNVGGIPYLLEDKKDALLVPVNNDEAMTLAIVSIVEGKLDVEKLVKNARYKVEQFDWSKIRYRWIDLFNSLPPKQRTVNRIYFRMPVIIQNILISTYGVYWKQRRLGGQFKKHIPAFKERELYTKKEWQGYQTKELRKLLIHAFTTVPLYSSKYKKAGFTLSDFESFELEDLKKLPYLEKEEFRKFGTTTLLANQKETGEFYASSGSTGTPIQAYFSKSTHQKWNAAYEVRVRNWAGVHRGMARGMIGGRRILNAKKLKPPYYRYNSAEKQTYFSTYSISDKTAADYIKGMFHKKIDYMVGYAMSNFLLAESIQKNNLKPPKMKAVLTSSEKLTKEMRNTIEKVYQCKVYDAYSGVEACGLISENKYGELLFSPDTGILEVLDNLGKEVRPGETGEIIATGLLNFDQPLIRYRIGDRVELAKDQKSKSGMHMPIISNIEGRVEDVVIARDGRKMVRFHSLFVSIPYLIAAQVIQLSLDTILIHLKVGENFDRSNEGIIRSRLQDQLGLVELEFKYVANLIKNANGKVKAVISHLKDSGDA